MGAAPHLERGSVDRRFDSSAAPPAAVNDRRFSPESFARSRIPARRQVRLLRQHRRSSPSGTYSPLLVWGALGLAGGELPRVRRHDLGRRGALLLGSASRVTRPSPVPDAPTQEAPEDLTDTRGQGTRGRADAGGPCLGRSGCLGAPNLTTTQDFVRAPAERSARPRDFCLLDNDCRRGAETKEIDLGRLYGGSHLSRISTRPLPSNAGKIAHGYDVANVGVTNSDDTLNQYILRKDDRVPYLVGGTPPEGPLAAIVPTPRADSPLHQIYPFAVTIDGVSWIAAQIRLFAHLRPPTPVYTVVMRRHHLTEGDPYLTVITKK